MDSIHFVVNYPTYLDEIEMVIKPELIPVLDDFDKSIHTTLSHPKLGSRREFCQRVGVGIVR
jgi:hypothetical protein